MTPVRSVLHVTHVDHRALTPLCSAARLMHSMCANEASPRQAHPRYVGTGDDSMHIKQVRITVNVMELRYFGRSNKHFRGPFRSTFQGCEYPIWATKRLECFEKAPEMFVRSSKIFVWDG